MTSSFDSNLSIAFFCSRADFLLQQSVAYRMAAHGDVLILKVFFSAPMILNSSNFVSTDPISPMSQYERVFPSENLFFKDSNEFLFLEDFFVVNGVLLVIERTYINEEYGPRKKLANSQIASLNPPMFPMTSKNVVIER